jgi:heat shock protein HslJ
MLKKYILSLGVLLTYFTIALLADPIDIHTLKGSWHLRAMDGMEVRKARAILDFKPKQMMVHGFDGCNRINGKLTKNDDNTFKAILISTRMACREKVHSWVSQRLHQTMSEGFTIAKEHQYNIDGITLKSATHTLFFKKMGKKVKKDPLTNIEMY